MSHAPAPGEPIEATADGCCIHLVVSPRASRTKLSGLHEGRIKLLVAAPPVDGEANTEVLAWLARTLGVGRSQLALVSGQSSRRKTVAVRGITPGEVQERLAL